MSNDEFIKRFKYFLKRKDWDEVKHGSLLSTEFGLSLDFHGENGDGYLDSGEFIYDEIDDCCYIVQKYRVNSQEEDEFMEKFWEFVREEKFEVISYDDIEYHKCGYYSMEYSAKSEEFGGISSEFHWRPNVC